MCSRHFNFVFSNVESSCINCENLPSEMNNLARTTIKSHTNAKSCQLYHFRNFKMSNLARKEITIFWCSLEYLLNSLQLILSFSTFVKFRIFWCFHRTSLFQIDLVLNLFEPFWIFLNHMEPVWTSLDQIEPKSSDENFFLCILVKNFDTRCRCGDFFMILKFAK